MTACSNVVTLMADVLKVVREPSLGAHLAHLSTEELGHFIVNIRAQVNDLERMYDAAVAEHRRRRPIPPPDAA